MLKLSTNEIPLPSQIMPLAFCKPGDIVEMVTVNGGRRMQNRISDEI